MGMELRKIFGNHLIADAVIGKNPVIIDAGASIGNSALEFQELFEDPKIICIEPSKPNVDRLSMIPGITIIHAALVGNNGPDKATFTEFAAKHEWGNIYKFNKTNGGPCIEYEVDTIKWKDLYSQCKKPIDYLKMDIECSETEVILSITQEEADNIKQISFEFHGTEQERIPILSHLDRLGYVLGANEEEIYARHSILTA